MAVGDFLERGLEKEMRGMVRQFGGLNLSPDCARQCLW